MSVWTQIKRARTSGLLGALVVMLATQVAHGCSSRARP